MCGNELNLVDSFLVTLELVEPALSKKWLCLLSIYLSLLVRSYMSITPGSANLEILIK